MIGQKFNKWTVLKAVKGPRRGKYFECSCECGNVKVVSGYNLQNAKSKQCQKCQKRSLVNIGDKFGSWQVIEIAEAPTILPAVIDCGSSSLP